MKKIIYTFLILAIVVACSSEKKSGNMQISGQIKGLKKGTLYLQKMQDTVLVTVDSVKLFGDDKFLLADNIGAPEMYYLTFDGNKTEKRIMFFAEEGNITINNDLDKFGINPKIEGSENQKIYEKFRKYDRRFVKQRLDFIKKDFDARKAGDNKLVKQLEVDYKKMVAKRFLSTTQFAKNNADKEIAPYLALSELFDANVRWLDTINNSLSENVKASKYGKQLQKFINEVKATEAK